MIKTKNQTAQGPAIDIKKTTPLICDAEGCESEVFMPAVKFRKVSKLLAGTKEDQLVPVQVFVCMACGNIPKELDLEI